MNKILLFLFTVAIIGFSSCEIDDGVYSDDVEGTYIISMIDSNLSGYETIGGSVIVTAVDDTTVDMLVEFDTVLLNDLNIPNVEVSDASNDDIDLNKSALNAEGLGYVNGDDLRFKLTYTDGNFIDIFATK